MVVCFKGDSLTAMAFQVLKKLVETLRTLDTYPQYQVPPREPLQQLQATKILIANFKMNKG